MRSPTIWRTPAAIRRHDERVCAEAAAAPKLAGQGQGDDREAPTRARSCSAWSRRMPRRRQRLDVIDFGDQVALACEIVATAPEVVATERERFGLVVLDEYQDTGVAQRVLLSRLFADWSCGHRGR